jgi:hypothetical protein
MSACFLAWFETNTAKHVASNSYTRYRPYPTPAQFSTSPDLIARTTIFLRRELRVWINLDVEVCYALLWALAPPFNLRMISVSHNVYTLSHEIY